MFYSQVEEIEYDEYDQPQTVLITFKRPDLVDEYRELISQNIKHKCVCCYLEHLTEEEEICTCGSFKDYLKRANDSKSYIGKMARTLNRDVKQYYQQFKCWENDFENGQCYYGHSPFFSWRNSYKKQEAENRRLENLQLLMHSPLPSVLTNIISNYTC
jgi:hypothetical protein